MYCINCGVETSSDPKFCRSCGVNMEIHSRILEGQPAGGETDRTLIKTLEGFYSWREKMKRWGFITLWVGLLYAALVGVTSGILGSLGSPVSGLLASMAGFGGLISLIGIGFMIYSRFLPEAPPPRQFNQQTKTPRAEITANMRQKLLPEEMPSITEHTTELFERSESKSPARETAPQNE